jgi:acyl-CoA synthetase (AMP-forming)/AMP-acid ligase II
VGWNFGDILDAISPVIPADAPAFIHGERTISWGEATKATNNLARGLIARGAKPGDKIAIYMRNRPEYLLALAAGFKARLTHVNVNYRYTPDEVWYIFDNSDAQTVVYASEFRDAVAQIRPRLPKVKTWIEVSPDGKIAPFAEPFERLAAGRQRRSAGHRALRRRPVLHLHRRHHRHAQGRDVDPQRPARDHPGGGAALGPCPRRSRNWPRTTPSSAPARATLPAPPLMHGTGLLTAMGAMLGGGSVVTLEGETFDAEELLRAIDRHKPQSMAIVGDSFAKPMLNALDAAPGKYDVSSLAMIISSGVMWSLEVKRGLLEHMPQAMLNDGFSSSEALGMGASVMTKGGEVQTAKFVIGERCKVFDENDQPVEPGSGVAGMVAIMGRPTRSATTRTRRRPPHLPHHRRRALFDPRRLVTCRGRRLAHPAGPRQRLHQHRRREGLPRGGRGGAEDVTRRSRTPWWSACRTRSGARR